MQTSIVRATLLTVMLLAGIAGAHGADDASGERAEPTRPVRKHVGQIRAGTITAVETEGGHQRFTLALTTPWQNHADIRFWCNATTFLLDGKASTFKEAVKVGRKARVEHVRGATPWVSVTSESPGQETPANETKDGPKD